MFTVGEEALKDNLEYQKILKLHQPPNTSNHFTETQSRTLNVELSSHWQFLQRDSCTVGEKPKWDNLVLESREKSSFLPRFPSVMKIMDKNTEFSLYQLVLDTLLLLQRKETSTLGGSISTVNLVTVIRKLVGNQQELIKILNLIP
jgi:hypothetical protein